MDRGGFDLNLYKVAKRECNYVSHFRDFRCDPPSYSSGEAISDLLTLLLQRTKHYHTYMYNSGYKQQAVANLKIAQAP